MARSPFWTSLAGPVWPSVSSGRRLLRSSRPGCCVRKANPCRRIDGGLRLAVVAGARAKSLSVDPTGVADDLQAGAKEGSDEGRPVLRRAWHAAPGAFGNRAQALGEYRVPAAPVAL